MARKIFVESAEAKERKLRKVIKVPENRYDQFLAEKTVRDDVYRLSRLEKHLADSKGIENMAFLDGHTDVLFFIKCGTSEQLDIFFAKFVQTLTNFYSADGLYKLGTFNCWTGFIQRIVHKRCLRTEINLNNWLAYALECQEGCKNDVFR